jgi:hypothetical protein
VPERSDLPPGVAETGVANVTALRAAHVATLRATSWTRESRVTVRYPNGTVYHRSRTISRFGGSRTHRAYVLEGGRVAVIDGGPVVERSGWQNRTLTLYRVRYRNGSLSYDRQPARGRLGEAEGTGVFQAFADGRTAVASTGRTGAVLTVTGTEYQPTVRGVAPVTAGRVRAVVTPRGLLRNVTVTYEADAGGQPVTVSYQSRIRAVGRTNVRRPAWVSVALAFWRADPPEREAPAGNESGAADSATGSALGSPVVQD